MSLPWGLCMGQSEKLPRELSVFFLAPGLSFPVCETREEIDGRNVTFRPSVIWNQAPRVEGFQS